MPRLLLVRHGTTDYNTDHRFLGHSDITLSDLGRWQVERLSDYLKDEKIDAIYASDLKRTMSTAQIITRKRDKEIVSCTELREIKYGACEGLTFNEIRQAYPEVAKKTINFTMELEFPGGEKFSEFINRSGTFLDRLKSCQHEETILIVSHNGPLKVLICRLLGIGIEHWWKLRLDVASLSIVESDRHRTVLSRLNDVSFLKNT